MSDSKNRLLNCLKNNIDLIGLSEPIDTLSNLLENCVISENSTTTNMNVESFAKLLPTFNGNPDHLENFISNIDDFYTSFFNTSEVQKKYVLASIRSKLVGEASDLLYCRSDITTWENLKLALRQKFGDKISYIVLLHELNYFNKNRNESLMDFIVRLKQFMQRIFSKIQTEEQDENVRQAFRFQTEKTSIITLISNSPDIVKSYLLTTNPKSLDDAIACISNYNLIESQVNMRYQLNQHNTQSIHHRHAQNPTFHTNPIPVANRLGNVQQVTSFPSQPINVHPRQIQHKFPTNIPAFRQPNRNVFAPQRNTVFPKPTPMSATNVPIQNNLGTTGTVSMRTYRPNFPQKTPVQKYNHFQNVQPPTKFAFQELTNLECLENPTTEDEVEDYEYSIDPGFPLPSEDVDPVDPQYEVEQTSENFSNTASFQNLT